MNKTDGLRACAALGWILSLAGCDIETRIASDGYPDAAPDAPAVSCVTPLDLDGDGEIDDRCQDGTDCDDTDSLIGQRATERCGNTLDDDCDARVDETGCATPRGAGCDEPTVVTATSTIDAVMHPWPGGERQSCGVSARAHHILRVDLAEPRSVRLSTEWTAADYVGASLASLSSCETGAYSCAPRWTPGGYGAGATSLAFAELPAGEHFFEVLTAGGPTEGGAASYLVEVRIDPVVAPPANDRCDTATLVPDSYGAHTFTADFVAAGSDGGDCGSEGGGGMGGMGGMGGGGSDRRDVFYRLELARPANLRVDVSALSPGSYGVSIQSGECGAGTSVRCVPEVREEVLARSLGAGVHVVALSGPDTGLAAVTLTLEPPTVAAPGETCADPIRLVSGATLSDTFVGRDLDIAETQCGDTYAEGVPLRDIVYDFVLTEPSDVEIRVRGPATVSGGMRLSTASIERVCGELGTVPAQRCSEPLEASPSTLVRTRATGLTAGRYFVVVSGERTNDVEVAFEARPAVPPTAVSGNVDCATAYRVDTGPGRHVYTGTLAPDAEAVFRVELTAPTRLVALSDGRASDGLGMVTGCSETAARSPVRGPVELEAGTYSFFLRNESGEPGPIDYEVLFELGGGT